MDVKKVPDKKLVIWVDGSDHCARLIESLRGNGWELEVKKRASDSLLQSRGNVCFPDSGR
jgi:hypothetical protein